MYNSANSFLKHAVLVLLLAAIGMKPNYAQEDHANAVHLFRLDGSFSTELAVKISSEGKSDVGFTLRDARLEADSMGALTRLRSVLTLANSDAKRRITEVEWRLDVYDEALHSLSQRVLQTDKVNIYVGETGVASAKFGAVLPDRMVVLLQLSRVMFADGSMWSPMEQCSLGEDLRTVSCKSK